MIRRGESAPFASCAAGLRSTLAAFVALVAAKPAFGQAQVPFDPAVNLQTLEVPPGSRAFLSVDDGKVTAPKQLSFDFLITYLTNPLVVYTLRDGELARERAVVVKSIVAGDLTFAYGIADKLQLGAALPVTFSMKGDGLSPSDARPLAGGLSVAGLGDMRLEAKYQFVHKPGFMMAVVLGAGLPTSYGSSDSEFLGDNFVSGRARLGMHWSSPDGKFSLGAHGGYVMRKTREIYSVPVGSQFVWAAGLVFRITEQFSLFGEGFGRTDIDLNYENSPVEAGGGVRLRIGKAMTFSAGGSTGVYGGIGSPEIRAFVSLGWAPDTGDSDGDGIANSVDKCVLLPEDFDGFEDRDGCPDPDNDGDMKLDGADKCPNEAEDADGYQDEDGCPDPDNDGDQVNDADDLCPDDKEDGKAPNPTDGCPFDKRDADGDLIPDYLDACPDQEEDLDGFEDADGCPELDNDKDGIDDTSDACPLCPEDVDGINDGDGCPELDNDRDGVIDSLDQCDGEEETINGVEDFDGCPDEGGAVLAELSGDRFTFVRAPEFDKNALNRVGMLVLDQVALYMIRQQDVTKWAVAVSAKTQSDSDARGKAIVAHLVSRGVPANRLAVVAGTGSNQVGIVVRERTAPVEGGAAGYCPADLQVKPRAIVPPK